MVNVYTEYFKSLMDYMYTLVGSSPSSEKTIELTYTFDDYQPSVGQQKQLIDTLAKAGVLEITHKVPLAPMVKLTMNTSGNQYSASGCAGYGLVLSKEAFLNYRSNCKLLKVNNDEHEYEFPHLSDDGRILYVEGGEVVLSKHGEMNRSYALAELIFNNEDYQCTCEQLADLAGDEKARQDPKTYAEGAVKYFNNYKVKIPNFIRHVGDKLVLNERYTNLL